MRQHLYNELFLTLDRKVEELTFGKPKAEQWLRLQAAYDLYQARTHKTELAHEVHALAA